ncbi:MAG: NAD(P)/FAD-dependent oxidoreductase [Magnetospiraceae bacterium]
MTSDPIRTDVAIIGAGPAGLFAIFECGMLKMSCHVIDALDMPGGQLSALYPEKPIYDIPAYPKIMAQDLVDKLLEQGAPFSPTFHFGQKVVAASRPAAGWWLLETDKGTKIEAKAVLIAAGAGAFGPNRPPLPGIEDYEGSGVFYMVGRRREFAGKRVVIAGGGDSAVDWALSLSEVAADVKLVHRRPKFRAAPESVAQLKELTDAGKVELVVPYQLSGLDGANGNLSAVIVKDLDGNERRLEADALLPFYGLAMELGPIADWGLALDQKYINVNPRDCATNLPGIFAIGDIATYRGKLKLILCGFSEAAMASRGAYALVHPDEALHFEYSTSMGVPG